MIKLSENFTLEEMIKSQTASRLKINNTPSEKIIDNLIYLCQNLLQPIRNKIGVIIVNSGYRSPKLNQVIGGSKTSQHIKGQAVDIESTTLSNIELGKFIENSGLMFDQLIYEFVNKNNSNSGWIHVSLTKNINRKQVLWIK